MSALGKKLIDAARDARRPAGDKVHASIVKAVRKHLRDDELAAALAWLKRVAAWEGCK